jgi:flagellar hook-length control protein FliK
VGSAPWGQELGQQMLLAVDGKLQTATLHLNPPQLGPLEVHLQMQAGPVSAQFASPHQAVREAVQSALPQLHDMFAGAGLNLSQASVGSGSPGREQEQGARRGASRAGMQLAADPLAGPGQTPSAGWLRGLVNTYV